jgi:hypothetical protein
MPCLYKLIMKRFFISKPTNKKGASTMKKQLMTVTITLAFLFNVVTVGYGIELFNNKNIKSHYGVNMINNTQYDINVSFGIDNMIQMDNRVLLYLNVGSSSGYTLGGNSSRNTFNSSNSGSALYTGGLASSALLISDFGAKTNPTYISIDVILNGSHDTAKIAFYAKEGTPYSTVYADLMNAENLSVNTVNLLRDSMEVSIETGHSVGSMTVDSLAIECNNLCSIKFTQLKSHTSLDSAKEKEEPPAKTTLNRT